MYLQNIDMKLTNNFNLKRNRPDIDVSEKFFLKSIV